MKCENGHKINFDMSKPNKCNEECEKCTECCFYSIDELEYKIGAKIDRCSNEILKIIHENNENFPRMEMLITNELMRIQSECEKLGVVYF